MFDADAHAGLRMLSARPEIEAGHVALMGFSYGGMAATYALYGTIAWRLAPDGQHFAAHIAYHAPCVARFDDSRTTGAPLLMLHGGQDQLIHPDRCAQVAGDLRGGGSAVTVVDYRQAVHQWDGELQPRLIGRHLADCRSGWTGPASSTMPRPASPWATPSCAASCSACAPAAARIRSAGTRR